MKVDKRLLIESIIVSILIVLAYLGWRIVQGYLLAKNYIPDIVNSYESTDYLQQKISFGIINDGNWKTVMKSFFGFSFLIITHYAIRKWLTQTNKINRVKKRFD